VKSDSNSYITDIKI